MVNPTLKVLNFLVAKLSHALRFLSSSYLVPLTYVLLLRSVYETGVVGTTLKKGSPDFASSCTSSRVALCQNDPVIFERLVSLGLGLGFGGAEGLDVEAIDPITLVLIMVELRVLVSS